MSGGSVGYFLEPPNAGQAEFYLDNHVYVVGDNVNIQWSASLDSYSIWMWQQSLGVDTAASGQAVYTKIIGGPATDNFNWTVSTQAFDLTQSNVFFFALAASVSNTISSNTLTSHYFNLTASRRTTVSSSSSVPSSIMTVTVPSMATATTAASAATTSSGANVVVNNDILKLGLGVGLGVGIPLLALILYLMIRLAQRHDRDGSRGGAPTMAESPPNYHKATSAIPQEPVEAGDYGHRPVVPVKRPNGQQALAELPGMR